jgi:hypothetical protein
MASTITSTDTYQFADGTGQTYILPSVSATVTTTNDQKQVTTQVIGFAAHEAITINSDIASPGAVRLYNSDPTNFITIGRDSSGTFVPMAELPPNGFPMKFRLPAGVTLYAKADTAACNLEVCVLPR